MEWLRRAVAVLVVQLVAVAGVQAAVTTTNKISDVRGTKHNFSATPDGSLTPSGGRVPNRSVKASSETQVCVLPYAAWCRSASVRRAAMEPQFVRPDVYRLQLQLNRRAFGRYGHACRRLQAVPVLP